MEKMEEKMQKEEAITQFFLLAVNEWEVEFFLVNEDWNTRSNKVIYSQKK